MQDAQGKLESHGASVLAVVVDAAETNAALATKLGVKFPILSDPDLATIRAWGVEHEGKDIALPATFVVGKDGRVAWIYVGDNPRDRPVVDAVVAVLASSQ